MKRRSDVIRYRIFASLTAGSIMSNLRTLRRSTPTEPGRREAVFRVGSSGSNALRQVMIKVSPSSGERHTTTVESYRSRVDS